MEACGAEIQDPETHWETSWNVRCLPTDWVFGLNSQWEFRRRYNMKPSLRICCLNSWFPYIEEALAHPSFTISLDSDLHGLSTRLKLEDWHWGRWMKDISTGHLQQHDILCVDMLCCAILSRLLLLQKGGVKFPTTCQPKRALKDYTTSN